MILARAALLAALFLSRTAFSRTADSRRLSKWNICSFDFLNATVHDYPSGNVQAINSIIQLTGCGGTSEFNAPRLTFTIAPAQKGAEYITVRSIPDDLIDFSQDFGNGFLDLIAINPVAFASAKDAGILVEIPPEELKIIEIFQQTPFYVNILSGFPHLDMLSVRGTSSPDTPPGYGTVLSASLSNVLTALFIDGNGLDISVEAPLIENFNVRAVNSTINLKANCGRSDTSNADGNRHLYAGMGLDQKCNTKCETKVMIEGKIKGNIRTATRSTKNADLSFLLNDPSSNDACTKIHPTNLITDDGSHGVHCETTTENITVGTHPCTTSLNEDKKTMVLCENDLDGDCPFEDTCCCKVGRTAEEKSLGLHAASVWFPVSLFASSVASALLLQAVI